MAELPVAPFDRFKGQQTSTAHRVTSWRYSHLSEILLFQDLDQLAEELSLTLVFVIRLELRVEKGLQFLQQDRCGCLRAGTKRDRLQDGPFESKRI